MRAESRKALAGAACLLVALLVAAPARGQETYAADHVQVLAVVDRFFETMTAADSAGARAIMLPEGVSFGVREGAEGLFLGAMPNAEYIAGLPERSRRIVERIWDPTVMIHERLAVVWAPYDLYADGEFLHCGVDAFTLLETEEGWKIAGVAFTMEPEGCEASPLGPLAE
jgi:hypothetical protein